MIKKITFGSRELNKLLDDTLMNVHSFPSETLMEIAGLSIAQVTNLILTESRSKSNISQKQQQICVLVGPGNNGGDGLVAARHLKMMHYPIDLIIFKKLQGKNGIYHQLCSLNGIKSYSVEDFASENGIKQNFRKHISGKSLIIDSIFGFPFTGEIKQPYRDFILELKEFQRKIFSVDIPSGWEANQGNIHNLFTPAFLISLGLPKQCSQHYKGEHYFGGRFIPESVQKSLNLQLPIFQNDKLYCKL